MDSKLDICFRLGPPGAEPEARMWVNMRYCACALRQGGIRVR